MGFSGRKERGETGEYTLVRNKACAIPVRLLVKTPIRIAALSVRNLSTASIKPGIHYNFSI
jgi:hypothetical protein